MTEADFRARAARSAAYAACLTALPEPPKELSFALKRALQRAFTDFNMVQPGDRLLLGLSGGKDSLTLLALLLMVRASGSVPFDLAACTVDPMYPGFDPSPLKAFLAQLGVPYYYAQEPVIDLAAAHMGRESICAWCSRMKRGILYSTARRGGYNVLVLGQVRGGPRPAEEGRFVSPPLPPPHAPVACIASLRSTTTTLRSRSSCPPSATACCAP